MDCLERLSQESSQVKKLLSVALAPKLKNTQGSSLEVSREVLSSEIQDGQDKATCQLPPPTLSYACESLQCLSLNKLQ